jgi:hypothetical protein
MSADDKTDNQKLEDILKTLPEDEKNLYMAERLKIFKLTIFICVVYAVIAAIMLLLAYVTEWGKKYLYGEMLPFIITYVIGTIIIIIFLSNEVYNYKPVRTNNSLAYDVDMCPDYWKLENVDLKSAPMKDVNGESYLPTNVNQGAFRYKCVMDPNVFDKEKIQDQHRNDDLLGGGRQSMKITNNKDLYKELTDNSSNLVTSKELRTAFNNFRTYSAAMAGYTLNDKDGLKNNNIYSFSNVLGNRFESASAVPIQCDVVYPYYLSQMDAEFKQQYPDEPPNVFRCAYAKTCSVDWTEAGCSGN